MGQAETVAVPQRLPLAVQPSNRDDDTQKDAKIVNAYVEKIEQTGEFWIYKRPGLSPYGSAQTGNGYGAFNWEGDIYAIFGATMYKNGVALSGTLDTTGGVYRFSSSLGATPYMQFGNGVASYNCNAAGTITAISGANFPSPAVKGWAYLDGTVYVADSNSNIHGCDSLNDPTTWTDTTNVIQAQIEPDGGVGLAKQLVYVIYLGQWSIEIFYDQQNATASPLGPVQGAKINYGCANADSVQELDGVLFLVATNRSAAPQILSIENLKPQIISTRPIERLLAEADLTQLHSFAIKYEGHRFYGITLISTNMTLVYDMTDKLWCQWTDANGNYFPIVATTFGPTHGPLLQHATNGKLYHFDSDYTTDDGEIITVDIFTPNFDGGVRRRKQLNMMEFIADQTPGSALQVRCNDWDYEATRWTNFRHVDLSVKKPILINNGTFMRRAYHLRHQCNTRLRLQAIELQIDLGTL